MEYTKESGSAVSTPPYHAGFSWRSPLPAPTLFPRACSWLAGKGQAREWEGGREVGFLSEPFPGSEITAALGSLPTLIIWRDKRQLPHIHTPPALQELEALIPLPKPFEVSSYLEQILQNALERRAGDGSNLYRY